VFALSLLYSCLVAGNGRGTTVGRRGRVGFQTIETEATEEVQNRTKKL